MNLVQHPSWFLLQQPWHQNRSCLGPTASRTASLATKTSCCTWRTIYIGNISVIYRYYIGVLSAVYVFARHFVAIGCAGSLQDHIRNISGIYQDNIFQSSSIQHMRDNHETTIACRGAAKDIRQDNGKKTCGLGWKNPYGHARRFFFQNCVLQLCLAYHMFDDCLMYVGCII